MDYISYSQYNSYTSCPRSWYLSKVVGAEEKQTWYIPIGTAVHNMIEAYIANESSFNAEDFFYPLIERQMAIEPDTSQWLAGGPTERPVVEELALQQVRLCFEEAARELEEIEVWEVEYDASHQLPGLEVPVRAYVDLLGEHKKKGPVILDWKTGSTKPSNFQLETYNALLKEGGFLQNYTTGKQHTAKGRYVMLAPGTPNTRYIDFKLTPEEVGAKYQEVYEQMQRKIYRADPGFDCKFCFHQDNCLANAGMTQRAIYFDRSEHDGIPF